MALLDPHDDLLQVRGIGDWVSLEHEKARLDPVVQLADPELREDRARCGERGTPRREVVGELSRPGPARDEHDGDSKPSSLIASRIASRLRK